MLFSSADHAVSSSIGAHVQGGTESILRGLPPEGRSPYALILAQELWLHVLCYTCWLFCQDLFSDQHDVSCDK